MRCGGCLNFCVPAKDMGDSTPERRSTDEGPSLLRLPSVPPSISEPALHPSPALHADDSLSLESGVSVEPERQHDISASETSLGSAELAHGPNAIMEDAKEQTIARLQDQLVQAHLDLQERDKECNRLSKMQNNVDKEIHDLTESLFKEAYKMVQDANEKRAKSEKLLREANGKIDVLQSEVEALKILVVNSIPGPPTAMTRSRRSILSPGSKSSGSSPRKDGSGPSSVKSRLFSIGHRRNHSDTEEQPFVCSVCGETEALKRNFQSREIDPSVHKAFASWREKHDIEDKDHPFLARVYREEISPCLDFQNEDLAERVLGAIVENSLIVEQINEERPSTKQCSLMEVPRICPFRMQINGDGDQPWYLISQLARNRITAVCDFFTYLRYLQQGLIKCGVHEAYSEIVRLRRNMGMAKLGLGLLERSSTSP